MCLSESFIVTPFSKMKVIVCTMKVITNQHMNHDLKLND
jgi:hypothetical protein